MCIRLVARPGNSRATAYCGELRFGMLFSHLNLVRQKRKGRDMAPHPAIIRVACPTVYTLSVLLWLGVGGNITSGQSIFDALPHLGQGKTVAENGLWIETPLDRQFRQSKEVTIAEVQGPGVITMIHFALPQRMVAQPDKYRLGRELAIRAFWDNETTPSVECPLVDFFCDPMGERESLDTLMVNKKRGWNAYFPMPFRKSAKLTLSYDGPVEPGQELWELMPCYSYVMVRKVEELPANVGYFHAQWRQQLINLGKEDYVSLDARGKGKFVGWNVTIRLPGQPGYPVDENEKFYVDGEETPSIEFQGLEDSFGFSWGFPPEESTFLRTGWFPFHKDGAAAYRFFLEDSISFDRSLKVTIGFGANEHPTFRSRFGKPGNELELSTTVYWYQSEPHAPFPALSPAEQRRPTERSWKDMENLPTSEALQSRGVKLHFRCGRPENETIFAVPWYAAEVKQGFAYTGWPFPVFHTRAHEKEVQISLTVPTGRTGILRLYMIDPDHFMGGRHQEVFIGDTSFGEIRDFDDGRWLEIPVDASMTSAGSLLVRIVNRNPRSNAVVSILEWVEAAASNR